MTLGQHLLIPILELATPGLAQYLGQQLIIRTSGPSTPPIQQGEEVVQVHQSVLRFQSHPLKVLV